MNINKLLSNPPTNAKALAEAQLTGADVATWFSLTPPEAGTEHAGGVYLTAEIPGIKETLVIWVKPRATPSQICKAISSLMNAE